MLLDLQTKMVKILRKLSLSGSTLGTVSLIGRIDVAGRFCIFSYFRI